MDAPNRRSRTALACCGLVLAVLFVYAQTARHDFVDYDTGAYVTENPWVSGGLTLEGVRWAFTAAHAANWHPLTWLSHMLDVELFGLNSGAMALENVAWHAANACLVLRFFQRATGCFRRSFFVAGLFALHPLHVESVAWIVERKDVLSTFFGLASWLAWTRWTETGRRSGYALALAYFALGLLAKPMLVSWPLVLLVFDRWPFARTQLGARRRLVEKLPFFALAGLASLATLLAQHAGGAVQGLANLPIAGRLQNGLLACATYLAKTIWPTDLAFYYPHPVSGFSALEIGLAALVLAGVSAAALGLRRRAPWLLAGWLFYLATLLPVIGIVQVGGQARADRYTYVPLLGVFVIVSWGATAILERRRALPILVAASLALLGWLAWRQAGTWKDTRTLAEHAIAVTRGNHVAHDVLGIALVEAGHLSEGEAQLRAALAIAPGDVDAASNLAGTLQRQGRLAEAEDVLRRALALSPERAALHRRLALVLQDQERFADALAEADAALARAPADPIAHHVRGQLLEGLGRDAEARAALEQSVAIAPRANGARLTLARHYLRLGEVDAAEAELARAIEDEPGNAEARRGRARVLLSRGREREAAAELEEALRLAPEWAVAMGDLAWLLATARDATVRDAARAVELAERAARASGGRASGIQDALAAAYAAAGRYEEASAVAAKALDLARAGGEIDLAARIEKRQAAYAAGRMDPETPR